MTWILVVAGVWIVCAIAGALLLGHLIGGADRAQRWAVRIPDHVPDDVMTVGTRRRHRRERPTRSGGIAASGR